jgi:hypothetical protein
VKPDRHADHFLCSGPVRGKPFSSSLRHALYWCMAPFVEKSLPPATRNRLLFFGIAEIYWLSQPRNFQSLKQTSDFVDREFFGRVFALAFGEDDG